MSLKKDVKLISKSPFFDAAWYLEQNPDVAAAGIDPARHYLENGWRERRNPSPDFDGSAYLEANPDVAEAKICPLLHFIKSGKREGRGAARVPENVPPPQSPEKKPPAQSEAPDRGDTEIIASSALFNAAWYLKQNPDVAAAGIDPAVHYLENGWKEGRNPSANFDGNAYLKTYPDVAAAKICPLLHFIKSGKQKGRTIAPVLVSKVTIQQPSNVSKIDPDFFGDLYLEMNPDLKRAKVDPWRHWRKAGKAENRLGATLDSVVKIFGSLADATKKNCIVVSHEASRTGAPINAWNLVRLLSHRFNVCSIVLRDSGEIEESFKKDSAMTIIFHRNVRYNDRALEVCLEKILGKTTIDFALVNSICSRATLRYFSNSEIPSILFVHEFAYYIAKSELEYGVFGADETVFSSRLVMNSVKKKIGIEPVEFPILPQGKSVVPSGNFIGREEHILFSKLKKRKTDGHVLVFGIGEVSYRKGCDIFIRVAAEIRKQNPDKQIYFVWLGAEFDAENDFYCRMLEAQIISTNMADFLEFAGSVKSIDRFYDIADLLLLPSVLDPLPGVVIESISHRVPVVCFANCSGFPELFSGYGLENACVAKYLDHSDMAEKASEILKNKDLRRCVSNRLFSLFVEKFDMKKYVENVLGMLPMVEERSKKDRTEARTRFNQVSAVAEGLEFLDFLTAVRAMRMGGGHYSSVTRTSIAGCTRLAPVIFGLPKEVPPDRRTSAAEVNCAVGGNIGNLAFHYALDALLCKNHSPILSWGDIDCVADIPQRFKVLASPKGWQECDSEHEGIIGVIPCANQLGPHCDMSSLVTKTRNAKIPLVAIGLGGQQYKSEKGFVVPPIPSGTKEWVKEVVAHAPTKAPNISLRGEFSMRVMETLGLADRAEVLGCPTLFINPDPKLGELINGNLQEPKRVVFATGDPWWEDSDALENSLSGIITESDGAFVVQSDISMLQCAMGEFDRLPIKTRNRIREHLRKNLSEDEFKAWLKRYCKIFFDIPQWMDFYRQYDFVVGPRIHGIMLALQAGVPALCVAVDSRTTELCETMKVPYVSLEDVSNGMTKKDLMKHFRFDPEKFDKNREVLAGKFVNFLKNNKISPDYYLRRIAGSA